MEILALFTLLQIKHFYADFAIQTYQQTVRKGIYKDLVGISHTLDHICATLLVLVVFNIFHPISASVILLLSLIEGIVHYHIDWIKVRFGTKNMQCSAFWQQFGIDQLAHQLTYIFMVWYLLLV